MNDNELHDAMRQICDNGHDVVMGNDWVKQLPFFGWFWRVFDWNCVPLGKDDENNVVGIMAKNKWYYPEYYCNETQSRLIRDICEAIAHDYSEDKVQGLAEYLQELGNEVEWQECDREAIDARTMQDFLAGNYRFITIGEK